MSKKINAAIKVIKEYEKIPTPQANKLDKLVAIIIGLQHSYINEKDIATQFSIVERQIDYYSNALRFLGIIDSVKYGKQIIIGLNDKSRNYFSNGNVNKKLKQWIIENNLIEKYEKELEGISNTDTYKRRLHSLNAWKNWLDKN